MNISTGGPHILLFERDQQLTGLLISEFQLAGYECHTARTAVEVFDAIARQPIRLVLVNLAQAAAARREFWVALDTQRRGRGVQVMTFHCSNIANYGPRDPDENATTMVDLEVDGMMGIMNLVDGVRARVPVGTTNAAPNQIQRLSRFGSGQPNPNANPNSVQFSSGTSIPRSPSPTENRPSPIGSLYNSQNSSPLPPNAESGFMRGGEVQARMQPTGQAANTTGNIPSQSSYLSSSSGTPPQQSAYPQNASAGNMPLQQATYTQNNNSAFQQATYTQNVNNDNASPQSSSYTQNMNASAQTSLYTQNTGSSGTSTQPSSSYGQNTNAVGNPSAQSMGTASNGTAQPTYTEKIRAVLYPNQRTWSPQGATAQTPSPENRVGYDSQIATPSPQTPPKNDQMGSTLQRLANGQTGSEAPWESGLAQLSRMVQERNNAILENTNNTPAYPSAPPPSQEWNNTPLENTNNTPAYPSTPPLSQEWNNAPIENTNNTPAYPSQKRVTSSFENTGNAPAYSSSPNTSAGQEPLPAVEKNFGQFSPSPNPTPATAQQTSSYNDNFSTRTMRASPIQDLPGERTTGGLPNGEGNKRPDVLSRTNYGQQPTPTHPSLASLSTAIQPEREKQETQERTVTSTNQVGMQSTSSTQEGIAYVQKGRVVPEKVAPKPSNETTRPIRARIIPEQPALVQHETFAEAMPSPQEKNIQERIPSNNQERTSFTESGMQTSTKGATQIAIEERMQIPEQEALQQSTSTQINDYKDTENKYLLEKAKAEIKVALSQHASFDISNSPSNALLLDIMQSLPPMPEADQQIQPQALNGRATRSLGSVLLEGHLVPQSRLEVAQNVQRMLRGVDLNYQLGEILLMFKLLTPDQLLAASLVSYGMITTTQISALGRIRQELHSIGLEYDLENLLIMFRILTPEQLREVRANWQ